MISIVVPVYNVSKDLPECMNSIANQDIEDIEIILVDDGSTDNSGELCDQYAVNKKNVKVIHQTNAGLSSARNAGIEIAHGEYISFIDSDDMIAPGFLNAALHLAEYYNADIVAFSYTRCESDAKWDRTLMPDIIPQINYYHDRVQKMRKFLIGPEIGTAAWAKIYRTELFSSIRYPIGKYHEDVFTTYKLVDKAKSIVTSSQIGYLYRNNPNSITSSRFTEKRLESIEGKLEQLSFIQIHYPKLIEEAQTGVIYACNQCVMLMSKSGYKNNKTEREIQQYYRKCGWSYLKSRVSSKGKLFTVIAMLDIKFAIVLYRLM